MSGVAKDDTNPSAASEDTVSAVGDAEAGHAEAPVEPTPTAPSEPDVKPLQRRGAPHLRVVSDASTEFVSSLPPQDAAPAPDILPNQRIGAAIRTRRESLGYTLEQVAKDTRVHLSHLRAIEDMTPNLLGAPVYAKGYIRAYARYLGLDETSTLDRYLRECAILKDPEKQSIAPPATGRSLPMHIPVLGFLVVALIGGAGYVFLANGNNSGDKPAAPAAAAGVPSADGSIAPDAGAAPVPAQQQMRVVALRRALLEVRSAAGDKYVHRYFEPGESYQLRVGAGWSVTAPEDGSAFEWRLGEDSLGLVTETGPAFSASVDIAAKRAPIIAAAPPPAVEIADTPAPTPTITVTSTTTTPAPTKPRAARPRTPAPATPAITTAPPPATTATTPPPPTPATPPPTTPAQDPSLLAYPSN